MRIQIIQMYKQNQTKPDSNSMSEGLILRLKFHSFLNQ